MRKLRYRDFIKFTSISCIGEGNGNALQCSCLENPRDGRAWWAADYGVAQSPTQLKWLSSSSSNVEGRRLGQGLHPPFRVGHASRGDGDQPTDSRGSPGKKRNTKESEHISPPQGKEPFSHLPCARPYFTSPASLDGLDVCSAHVSPAFPF